MDKNAKIVKDSEIFTSVVFKLVKRVVALGEKTFSRDIVLHPGAVVIIPQDENGRLGMVRQYRAALGEVVLEFPAGTLEKGEAPLTCAKRELIEEVKKCAAEWIDLGTLYPSPGISSEVQYCYLARSLKTEYADLDEDELLDVEYHSVEEVEQFILSGDLNDAKSLAIFMRARLLKLL